MIENIPPALTYPESAVHYLVPSQEAEKLVEFRRIPGTFQGYHWTHAVRVERGISVEEALQIAANDPNIDYFCYTTAGSLVLNFIPGEEYHPEEDPLGLVGMCYSQKDFFGFDPERDFLGSVGTPTYARQFGHGDVVFFAQDDSKKYFGDAGPLGESYEKIR